MINTLSTRAKNYVEKKIKGKCLNCGHSELSYKETIYDTPNIGEILLFSFECEKCGFIFKDFFSLEDKGYKKLKVIIKDEKALNTLLVRGDSCYIYLENLDLEIKPIEGEIFITTFEGLLSRIEKAVYLMNNKKIIEKFNNLKKVKEPLIFIFEDKKGITNILNKRGDIIIEELHS